ncbi:HPr family phosphocarrier protein [Thermoanaerobacteraceae bacterium SP2]|nr:HPr family phosphocarrier protein [Thermoanaerobacteraceae bacterium SP2]
MLEKQVTVKCSAGLHARPASKIVEILKKYKGDVYFVSEKKNINCKSMIQLMTAQIKQGDRITIKLNGSDEADELELMKEIIKILDEDLGELKNESGSS